MTRHPLSINESATLREAAAFLTEKGISAAPVISEAGRPVGVLSLADIVRMPVLTNHRRLARGRQFGM